MIVELLIQRPGYSEEAGAKLAETTICRMIAGTTKVPEDIDKRCISKLNNLVRHENDSYKIFLRNGGVRIFKDTVDCEMTNLKSTKQCVAYKLNGGYQQNDAIVVERWLDSGPTQFQLGAYMVERATGRVIDLPDEPHYSPDGQRFVSMSVCHDHCANRIDIWALHDGVAKLEWRHRVKQGEPSFYYKFEGWQGNSQVNLRIFPEGVAEGDTGRAPLDEQGADAKLLQQGPQEWRLMAPPAR